MSGKKAQNGRWLWLVLYCSSIATVVTRVHFVTSVAAALCYYTVDIVNVSHLPLLFPSPTILPKSSLFLYTHLALEHKKFDC